MARYDDPGVQGPQLALPRLTPAVRAMLIFTVALYVVELVVTNWIQRPTDVPWFSYVMLQPRLIFENHQLWRVLTWPLAQGNRVESVLWSIVGLYFFGTDLEDALSTKRFLLFTFMVILASGLVATLFGKVHPVYYTQPVFGLSALSYALLAAWGQRFPERRMLFPPVSARVFVYIMLGVSLLFILANAARENPAASLGAIGVGWFLGKYWDRIDDYLDRRRVAALKKKRDRIIRGGGATVTNISEARRKPTDKRYLN